METIEVSPLKRVDFGATGLEEIIQNVSFILSSIEGTFPMDRFFGWQPDIDGPIQVVKARMTGKIVELIREYEPRVQVESVLFEENALDGSLMPIVRVKVNG
jgi:uncharacterized protein